MQGNIIKGTLNGIGIIDFSNKMYVCNFDYG